MYWNNTVLSTQYLVLSSFSLTSDSGYKFKCGFLGTEYWAHLHFGCVQGDSKTPLLEFRNLRVMRGQKIALDDFSLCIGADEHVAILGPNGCGKSTLIKTITRECYPVARDDSSMAILGQETWDVFKLRSYLGIVSNDLMLSCTGDASGIDVVLSGFFSSTAIYPNHLVEPGQKALARSRARRIEDCTSGGSPGLRDVVRRGAAGADCAGAGPQTTCAVVRRALQLSWI